MDKNENLKDRLMDELLREDARGDTADEKMLTAVEAARMVAQGQDMTSITVNARLRLRVPTRVNRVKTVPSLSRRAASSSARCCRGAF